ncbi:hypothetical protein [Ornithinibacillus sp. 179-J 7C1 HS]|uniref:hypothetical protein n=1 Tax=Ornithinibacillus sp. 179-J 7C1 HS TaxID=3142384 RepID=UPI0039A342FA
MKLSAEQLNITRDYLIHNCRKLEIARFEFLFGNGTKDTVIESLKEFQNEDGGFGHGIEPDFWLPKSSAMASWAAGQVLIEVGAEKDEPLVQSLVSYLVNTFEQKTAKWASVRPENNDYPHAPWWHWNEGAVENWSYNPSIELAANLIHWSEPDSKASELGWNSIEKAVTHLMVQHEMDKHEINNFQQFIKIIKPYKTILESIVPYSYEQISDKINDLALDCINKDVAEWDTGYVSLPLDFIHSPNDPLCRKLGSLIEKNFTFYLEKLSDEGIWDISWTWGSYEEEYEVARTYWKGILAVERYKRFDQFGYLEKEM